MREPQAGPEHPRSGRGPLPLRAVLAEVLVDLLARHDPAAARLLAAAGGPLDRAFLAAWWPTAPPGTRLEPQQRIGPYRVGFLIDGRVVVDIDRHPARPPTPEQAVRDRQRDRYLVARGFAVLRFAAAEVSDDPWRCGAEVNDYLLASARRQGA